MGFQVASVHSIALRPAMSGYYGAAWSLACSWFEREGLPSAPERACWRRREQTIRSFQQVADVPKQDPSDHFSAYRWQWVKHTVLADYFPPWAGKVGSTSREIFIVDTFAGAGSYPDPETGKRVDGSPVLAAGEAVRYASQRPGKRLTVLAVEKHAGNYAKLEARLGGFDPRLVALRQGDWAKHLDWILGEVGDNPILLILDPLGLKAMPADITRRILHRRGKTDAFVTVHFGVVHRAAGQLLAGSPHAEKTAANLDAFFGTDEWRAIALDAQTAGADRVSCEHALLDLYFREMLSRRFEYVSAHPVRPGLGRAHKYWLVHAADVIDGFLLMNDAIVKVEEQLYIRTRGKGALPGLAEEEVRRKREEKLGEVESRALQLVGAADGKAMVYADLENQLLDAFFGKVRQSDLWKAVKRSAKAGNLVREDRAAAGQRADETFRLP
jgi:three-Cys-motif partner protein